MDPNTGHLVILSDKTEGHEFHRYEKLPGELNRAAKRALKGKKETTIDLRSTDTLSRWAKKKREEKKRLAMSNMGG